MVLFRCSEIVKIVFLLAVGAGVSGCQSVQNYRAEVSEPPPFAWSARVFSAVESRESQRDSEYGSAVEDEWKLPLAVMGQESTPEKSPKPRLYRMTREPKPLAISEKPAPPVTKPSPKPRRSFLTREDYDLSSIR
ncbi:MAG: hypothetical protein AAF555_11880 [Verrucomicrobiota bacterium]